MTKLGGILSDRDGFGTREDGTPKGRGFLGLIPMADGSMMSELSVGVELDGKETLIPSVVPTLTEDEIEYLRQGGSPLENNEIMDKAVAHALERLRNGQSPFFD